jgi:hypothetical protein
VRFLGGLENLDGDVFERTRFIRFFALKHMGGYVL